jgi:hypothetical protein
LLSYFPPARLFFHPPIPWFSCQSVAWELQCQPLQKVSSLTAQSKEKNHIQDQVTCIIQECRLADALHAKYEADHLKDTYEQWWFYLQMKCFNRKKRAKWKMDYQTNTSMNNDDNIVKWSTLIETTANLSMSRRNHTL